LEFDVFHDLGRGLELVVTAMICVHAKVLPVLLLSTVLASCLGDSSGPANAPTDAATTSDTAGTAGVSSGGATSSDGGVEDAATGGVAGSAVACPPKSTSCPTGCSKVSGQPVDFENKCLYDYEPLGCYFGTGGELAMYGCIRDPDTTISYKIPSVSAEAPLFTSGEWVPCPDGWMTFNGPCP